MRSHMRYDLIVIGSGPAGQKGAIAAAKLGKRVAIIERRSSQLGGACLHTGTIPSKTMREAIMYLSGFRQRDVYSEQYRRKRHIRMEDLQRKIAAVAGRERQVIEDQLDRNGVEIFSGNARFLDSHTVEVAEHGLSVQLAGSRILIATGTRPFRDPKISFDGRRVFDSDELLELDRIPRSMIVIGGGVIGLEYGIMFQTLGVQVTVVDGRDRLLPFCDREITETLQYHARSIGLVLRLGEDVVETTLRDNDRVAIELESGKRLVGESVLIAMGRTGDTADLNLPAAGLSPNDKGRITCSEHFQTDVPHIYAVGDVVGFPALASASMEQGRQAVRHAFGSESRSSGLLPYGLFTIPEIAMVGESEETLTAEHVPYETGVARFREIARGQIAGDRGVLLKLLFHRETKRLLGVHCIGHGATEIIHIGQAVMHFGGTIDYFRDTVFNYPTMAECYKVAAFDGLNKLELDAPMDDREAAILEDVHRLARATDPLLTEVR